MCPPRTLVFFQNFISLLSVCALDSCKGVSANCKTSRIWLHMLRAGAGLLSQVLMFAAVKQMPLVNAVLLIELRAVVHSSGYVGLAQGTDQAERFGSAC